VSLKPYDRASRMSRLISNLTGLSGYPLTTPRPIETSYRGCRFRSRLAARWAVFFDAYGVPWQYEPQGFPLGGALYVPTFFLPTLGQFVDVRPPPRPTWRPPSIFMAGTMWTTLDDEGRLVRPCWRPFDYLAVPAVARGAMPSRICYWDGEPVRYVGPFVHFASGDLAEDSQKRALVYERALAGIRACDVFFAFFEDFEALGSLVEVGYAAALGKAIVLGFADEVFPAEDGDSYQRYWLAASTAVRTYRGCRDEVVDAFRADLSRRHPMPPELKRAYTLAYASGYGAVVVYSDPVDALGGSVVTFQGYGGVVQQSPFDNWDRDRRDAAALAARQARFEHGQVGAAA
jgi:hypothetical protein